MTSSEESNAAFLARLRTRIAEPRDFDFMLACRFDIMEIEDDRRAWESEYEERTELQWIRDAIAAHQVLIAELPAEAGALDTACASKPDEPVRVGLLGLVKTHKEPYGVNYCDREKPMTWIQKYELVCRAYHGIELHLISPSI